MINNRLKSTHIPCVVDQDIQAPEFPLRFFGGALDVAPICYVELELQDSGNWFPGLLRCGDDFLLDAREVGPGGECDACCACFCVGKGEDAADAFGCTCDEDIVLAVVLSGGVNCGVCVVMDGFGEVEACDLLDYCCSENGLDQVP